MKVIELKTKDGIWKVYIDNDEVCIVDQEMRCRHRSKGHDLTAVYLAGALVERPFHSNKNADEALRLSAKAFVEGI